MDRRNQKRLQVVIPEGIGGGEWQGQTKFFTEIPASVDKLYDFCVTLNSTADCTVTLKLAWKGNDNDHAIFYVNDFNLSEGEDITFKQAKVSPDVDYDAIVLFIDLGRSPVGSKVTMTDFCFQEHLEK